MAPWQPQRAFVGGTMTAVPLALLSGILLAIGGDGTDYGFYVLHFLPFATGVVTAWFVHAVDAILLTAFLSAICASALVVILGGVESIGALVHLLVPMFAAAVLGAVVGLFVRPFIRKRFGW